MFHVKRGVVPCRDLKSDGALDVVVEELAITIAKLVGHGTLMALDVVRHGAMYTVIVVVDNERKTDEVPTCKT